MNVRAQWVEGIDDLYSNLAAATNYLTVADVAEELGLSQSTIADLLSRPPIDSERNVLRSLSRPAARIGSRPLYSREQVAEARDRQHEDLRGPHRYLGGGAQRLERVSLREAWKRSLISTSEIATLCGRHPQTVRRWSRNEVGFPPAVALRQRPAGSSGVPIVVREKAAVVRWLLENGETVNESALSDSDSGLALTS
jgi:AraC-like DNA-binding protein